MALANVGNRIKGQTLSLFRDNEYRELVIIFIKKYFYSYFQFVVKVIQSVSLSSDAHLSRHSIKHHMFSIAIHSYKYAMTHPLKKVYKIFGKS